MLKLRDSAWLVGVMTIPFVMVISDAARAMSAVLISVYVGSIEEEFVGCSRYAIVVRGVHITRMVVRTMSEGSCSTFRIILI